MTREEFEKNLRDAGFKFDGHVTQGSFQAQLMVIDEYMKTPHCPRCGSYKLSCRDGHTWEIPTMFKSAPEHCAKPCELKFNSGDPYYVCEKCRKMIVSLDKWEKTDG